MHVTEWDRIQAAKTLSGCARRSRGEADGTGRRMLEALLEFWKFLPEKFFSYHENGGDPLWMLDLTPYLPAQPRDHTIAFIRIPGYAGLAVLTPAGFHETIPNPLQHPLRSTLYQFDAALQAQHLCPRLSELEGIEHRGHA